MSIFEWTVALAGCLIIPIVSLSYIKFRLEARREQLIGLFSRPGILEQYLQGRGQDWQRIKGETDESYLSRIHGKFLQVFENEFGREYSRSYYLFSCLIGSVFSGLVVFFLVGEALGLPLIHSPVPVTVKFALLGGLFWSIWTLVRNYSSTDLVPSTFYWMILRYVLAIAIGLLTPLLFTEALANLGAFVLSSLPVSETMTLVRAKLSQSAQAKTFYEGYPPLEKIQGMDRSTMDKLEEIGISTTQELAYIDPLELLFRTNIPPIVLIDWMDQALLYNFTGELSDKLRVRGIRGATELAVLHNDPPEGFLEKIALPVLGIDVIELKNLITNLFFDNQVRLVWEIWGGLGARSEGGDIALDDRGEGPASEIEDRRTT